MWLLVQKQALVSIPLALAVFLAAHNPGPLRAAADYLAILVFLVAIGGEALADRQLRLSPHPRRLRGGICEAGLWRWSRHPNYFFEWLGWLAYPLLAIDLSGGIHGAGSRCRAGLHVLAAGACVGHSAARSSTCCERAAKRFAPIRPHQRLSSLAAAPDGNGLQ